MTSPASILRRLRLVLAAVAAISLLVVPSSALAKKHHGHGPKDRNRDGIPDKWEKKHGISTTKRGMAKADPDKDGLANRFEWRAGTNPKSGDTNGNGVRDANEDMDRDAVDNGNEQRERTQPCKADSDGDGVKDGKEDADRDRLDNAGEDDADTDPMDPDSDGDGVKDGDEHAGEISAWDGTTLTIRVYGGATLSGVVDEDTYLGCSAADDSDSGSGDGSDLQDDPTWSGDPTEEELGGKVRAREDAGDAGDDDLGDDSDLGDDDPGADDGSDDGVDDGSDGSGNSGNSGNSGDETNADACLGALKVGAKVSEASLDITSEGAFFDTVELDD
jgi:hypothetical protein